MTPRSVTGTAVEPLAAVDHQRAARVAAPAGTCAETVTFPDCPRRGSSTWESPTRTARNPTPTRRSAPYPVVPACACGVAEHHRGPAPAAGCSTWTLPYPATPCGDDCAANLPCGSIRISRIRSSREARSAALAGHAIDASSSAAPLRDLEVQLAVVALGAGPVREVRALGVAQCHAAGSDHLLRPDRAPGQLHHLRLGAGVGNQDRPRPGRARAGDRVELDRRQAKRLADRVAVRHPRREFDGLGAVQQPGALLGRGRAQVPGGGQQDVADL